MCGCGKAARHNYTHINIDSYTTKDIEFYTEYESYTTDDTQFKCFFTYNGNKDFVHLSDIANCFLIKKTNNEWYKLEVTGEVVDFFCSKDCLKGIQYTSTIRIGAYYDLPLETGLYRLVWDNYVSDAFKIENAK